jgi:hypothetical protein
MSVGQTDEDIVDRARRIVAAKGKFRWGMLLYAGLFLGFSGFFSVAGVRKIEALDTEQLKMGFIYGLSLAVVWTTFGIAGAICLGKVLVGFDRDVCQQQLLLRYHDRLRDLGQLPDKRDG